MDIQGTYRKPEKESSLDESKPKLSSTNSDPKQSRPLYSQTRAFEKIDRDIVFWAVVFLSQVVGIAFVVLIGYWCSLYGGYAWESDADLQFNFHPVLMVLGLVFCYGEAILIYRVLSFLPKWILKLIHAALQLTAIISSSVGLAAVFENHRRTYKADFYSLHSWVGLCTFGFFCMQFVASFVVFLVPGMPLRLRAMMMPFHTFFGIGIFLMAVGSTLMGFTEKLLWTNGYSSGNFTTQGVLGNCTGLLIVVFTYLVVFLATYSKYKRKPLPSEMAPSTN